MFSEITYLIIESFFILFLIYLLGKYPALISKRHLLMLLGLSYVFFIARQINLKIDSHLFSLPSFSNLFFAAILPSALISLIFVIVNHHFPTLLSDPSMVIRVPGFPKFTSLILYPLLSVPLQELLFRWFYLGRLDSTPLSGLAIIFINALVFGLFHLPFGKPSLFFSTFFLALWWNTVYLNTGNLWYSIISHSIVGNSMIALALYDPKIIEKYAKY